MEKLMVEVVSRKSIKPFIPTPHHLRTFNLSALDQDVLAVHYGSVIFFYPSDNALSNTSQKSRSLQNSLSQILIHFYPLAGQLTDMVTIECNDEGACFVEAKSRCRLMELLANPDPELLKELVPSTDPKAIRSTLACILLVQLTSFECGGTAVAISVSQKFGDASSFCTFIQSWTAISGREYGGLEVPRLVGASMLPPLDTVVTSIPPPPTNHNCTTQRFVFREPHIANLKARVATAMKQQLGDIRDTDIVLAIILRCAAVASAATSRSKDRSSSQPRRSALLNVVNLRKRMAPPLPGNTIGNLVLKYAVKFAENDVQLHQLVSKMKKEFTNVCNDKVKEIKTKKGHNRILESRKQIAQLLNGQSQDINTYTCTNLCGYPFHEIDFGWGKPTWVTSPTDFKNSIVMLDSKWGSIEAWVTLDQLEMGIFERDKELLAVASLNPNVLMNYSRI